MYILFLFQSPYKEGLHSLQSETPQGGLGEPDGLTSGLLHLREWLVCISGKVCSITRLLDNKIIWISEILLFVWDASWLNFGPMTLSVTSLLTNEIVCYQ